MKRKDVVFDAEEFVRALEETADHITGRRKTGVRITRIALPPRMESIRPREIKAIRDRMKISQEVFARLLNVPTVTEASWETGRRNPSGAALRLLQVAKKRPDALLDATEWRLHESVTRKAV